MSLPADIVATFVISSIFSIGRAYSVIWYTTYCVAFSIPRLRTIGFAPAATLRIPCFIIAYASTVAVVVPSPATSLVFEAACRINETPVFSRLSTRLISFAIVTPSLTICGVPNFFSSTTFLPFGPSVIATASASVSIPRSSAFRASSWYNIVFDFIQVSDSY